MNIIYEVYMCTLPLSVHVYIIFIHVHLIYIVYMRTLPFSVHVYIIFIHVHLIYIVYMCTLSLYTFVHNKQKKLDQNINWSSVGQNVIMF